MENAYTEVNVNNILLKECKSSVCWIKHHKKQIYNIEVYIL
jgi:hypothetical protein